MSSILLALLILLLTSYQVNGIIKIKEYSSEEYNVSRNITDNGNDNGKVVIQSRELSVDVQDICGKYKCVNSVNEYLHCTTFGRFWINKDVIRNIIFMSEYSICDDNLKSIEQFASIMTIVYNLEYDICSSESSIRCIMGLNFTDSTKESIKSYELNPNYSFGSPRGVLYLTPMFAFNVSIPVRGVCLTFNVGVCISNSNSKNYCEIGFDNFKQFVV